MKPTLHLTLKKKWFDMIADGTKREEYREPKPYWCTRLARPYGQILFRNGYAKDSPTMLVEFIGLRVGVGRPEWGAPRTPVFIIRLGWVIMRTNQLKP